MEDRTIAQDVHSFFQGADESAARSELVMLLSDFLSSFLQCSSVHEIAKEKAASSDYVSKLYLRAKLGLSIGEILDQNAEKCRTEYLNPVDGAGLFIGEHLAKSFNLTD